MTDTGAGRRADGGRTVGEVAEGVTLIKNARVEVRDGTRLATDIYMPTGALEAGRPVSLVMEYIPYRKDEVVPGSRFYEYLPHRLRGRARRHPRHRRLPRREHRRVPAPGAAGRRRRRRVVRGPGLVHGPRQHDGHLLRRLHVAAGREPRAGAPDSIIPMFFTDDRYTDDCHFRGGLMRKVLRRQHVRQHDLRLERAARFIPQWSRGLGAGLGGASSPATSRTYSSGSAIRLIRSTGATARSATSPIASSARRS